MLKTDKVIVVEGKYDAIRLANLVDAAILRTEGFGVFKDHEKQELLRTLAEKRGLLVLTDGDSAGMLIRNYIRGLVPAEQITDVYVPDLYGKEKRKDKPSKEGKLGVEGIPDDYSITLESVEDGVSVPDGEDRFGKTYNHSRYEINSRISELKYVERDDDCRDVTIQMDITLEEA